MALEGSLKDFSVLDILQLISSQQKTGTLTITSKKGKIVVDFKKGMLTSAFHVKRGEQLLLDEYLLSSGRLSEENYAKVRKSHEETGLPLDEILIKDGYLSEEEFKEIITFKIQEIIDELFMWHDGTYRFELSKELYPYSRVKVSLRTEALIMEGARRADELPRIEAVLPDENVLIAKTGKVVAGLEPAQKKLLSFLAQPHTVAELVRKMGIGKFRTCEALFRMINAGVAKTAGVKEPEVEQRERPREAIPRKVWETIVVGCIGAAVVFGIWILKDREPSLGPFSFRQYSRWRTEKRLESVENSLKVYFLLYGKYPTSLEELKAEGLADQRDVTRLEYVPSADLLSYTLTVSAKD
ncbi:hypothetical protein AMJ40_00180 [candidate division TA06 bacterium DG_26]|uniref:PatA-like N-terminal domain-containing protein n=1 Tax=candidate division TA06 bacterium DG_26 TaxID=1703771 RepID=A0A0S7WN81_UNCT6|nr:MAG: hypothetical protein AMJ40_00180 [candidate division TA06 bacterium DG_26]